MNMYIEEILFYGVPCVEQNKAYEVLNQKSLQPLRIHLSHLFQQLGILVFIFVLRKFLVFFSI